MARQVGLKNLYAAEVLTDQISGVTTYAAPRRLERAIKATIKPKFATNNFFSDDALEEVGSKFVQCDVTIEQNQLSLSSRAFLQGSKVIKGQLVENKDDLAPTVALGFQSRKSNGAYRYVWLYKGKFTSGDDAYESEADKIKDQTASITATFYSRDSDGNWRTIADTDEADIDTAKIAAWFTTVAAPAVGSIVTTLSVVAGMGAFVTGIAGTVATVATGTTVAELKLAVEVDGGKGTFAVYATASKAVYALDVATVVNTMVIHVVAEDGTTNATYTIVVA